MNAQLICNGSSRHMEHVTMSYLAPCRGMSVVHGLHNQTIKVWKLSDGTCVDTFLAHDGPINTTLINEADHRLDQLSSKLD
jgi:COMPASS component SWD3